jgi:hypothetical protein
MEGLMSDHLQAMLAAGEISRNEFRAGRKYQAMSKRLAAGTLKAKKAESLLTRQLDRLEDFVGRPGVYLLYDVLVEGAPLEVSWTQADCYDSYEDAERQLRDSLGKLTEAMLTATPLS